MARARMAVRLRVRPRGRLSWAGWTVAPWVAATALLVSFVADAGQDLSIGATRFALTSPAFAMPGDLIGADLTALAVPRGLALTPSDSIVREARLIVGDVPHEVDPDEIDPRTQLKSGAHEAPAIDRSHKGDPGVGLRPTFEARLRSTGSLDLYRKAALAFDDSDPGVTPGALQPPTIDIPGPDSVARFEPLPDGATITTRPSVAGTSPGGGVAGATTPMGQDGSTPDVARAIALASATPAAADAIPVQIAPLPKFSRGPDGKIATGSTLVMGMVDTAPAFAAVMDQSRSAAEQRCLAEAIYFEARSEPEEGQAAVAQVVLNRVMSGLYPPTVCGVVFQNHQRHNACQFSFACEGKALRIAESPSWAQAVRVAREVTDGATYVSDIGGSTHYHANYVAPGWARRLIKMDKIGQHIFYKLRPGQT